MSQRAWLPPIAVVLGYCVVAAVMVWPLPLQFGTALLGDPGGDTGVYVWNQWIFQQEVLSRHNPFYTERVLSLTDRVDLSQHNYTVFLNVLAFPLIQLVGVVSAFNLVILLSTILTAVFTYALARRVVGASHLEAWIAGLAFAWSPALVARSTGHLSLVAAAPLAAFLLCLIVADRSRRPRDAALAGLAVAWAGFCDPYYAVYCLLIAGGYVLSRLVRVSVEPHRGTPRRRWALNISIVSLGGLVCGLMVNDGVRFEVLGLPVSIRGLYTPVLLLTLLVIVRLSLRLRAHSKLPAPLHASGWVRLALAGLIACAVPLSPVLYGLGERWLDGRYVSPPTYWRSSPRGVDALALLHPNPNHALSRAVDDRQAADGAVFAEYTAALSLVALAVIAIAVWRAGFRPRTGWLWLTIGFAVLSLGPFVYIAGTNTYVPGPWALLRYVPVLSIARTPTRFSIVAALGLALLLAAAMATLGSRFPQKRRWIAALVGLLIGIELTPAPRRLYSAEVPEIYRQIGRDTRDVRILQLPFGVRDGTFTAGNFSARSLYYQTAHGKRLIGGYLSRISSRRVQAMRAQPTLDGLMKMSEGLALAPEHAAWLRSRGPGFVARTNLGYVVIDHSRTPDHLVSFAIEAWSLEPLAQEGVLTLYRPATRLQSSKPPD